jgi:hypothetical protein
MIFTDNKITKNEIKVRFFYFENFQLRIGDAGTHSILNVKTSDFIESKLQQKNNSEKFFFSYELIDIDKILSYPMANILIDYEIADQNHFEHHNSHTKKNLNNLKNIHNF